MRCAGRLGKGAKAMAQKPLAELVNLFGPKLALSETFGNPKRRRLLFPERIFWLFLAQVLSPDGSCREAVSKFLVWLAVVENKAASPCTGGYCEARARLPLDALREVHGKVAQSTEVNNWRWLGRAVKVVDGSSVSMPDTPKNQKQYPQPSAQKPGCGFPVMRVVALFSLGSGMLLELAKGALSVHERTLFRQLWDSLSPDDVVLADSGFCGYADFHLLRRRGVDSVMRNHGSRTRGRKEIKRLGGGDFLVQWLKPKRRPQWLSKEEWREIPDFIEVREVRVAVEVPGFRTKHLVVATTLLDDVAYPKEAIAQLYRKRWAVELYLRDIKITMGMDILRCKSPDMVEKELWMHVIAHNLLRKQLFPARAILA